MHRRLRSHDRHSSRVMDFSTGSCILSYFLSFPYRSFSLRSSSCEILRTEQSRSMSNGHLIQRGSGPVKPGCECNPRPEVERTCLREDEGRGILTSLVTRRCSSEHDFFWPFRSWVEASAYVVPFPGRDEVTLLKQPPPGFYWPLKAESKVPGAREEIGATRRTGSDDPPVGVLGIRGPQFSPVW